MKTAARASPVGDRDAGSVGGAGTARLPARPIGIASPAASLTIGPADDFAEREADLLADQAIAGLPLLRPRGASPTLRRMCAACEEEEDKKIRRKAEGGDRFGGTTAPAAVTSLLARPGQSLDPTVRTYFEQRFARDFGQVEVHDGPAADTAARSIGARAFAAGSHIAFARGQYQPHSDSGRRLLAHELAHVAQGGAPILRRKPGDDDPLLSVTLALISATPPIFRATFAFKKASSSFEVKLSGHKSISLTESTQQISATPFYRKDDDDIPKGVVLFSLPDQGGAYVWFLADEQNKDALVRASEYLQAHDPVPLIIRDATKVTAQDDKEAGEKGDAPAPKFTAAEDWLAKEMLPAVTKVLAEDHSSVAYGKLIPYRSAAIQAAEGPDISLIQVNKPDSKEIAGHIRVDRRKWVGQDAQARDRFVRDTAAAIVAKLTEAARKERLKDLDASLAKTSTGETFPAWAIKLKQEVDKKLGEARAAAPPGKPPQDLPDRVHLTQIGNLLYLQLFLERRAENDPSKPIWQTAVVTPWLEERHADDIDALVKAIREQTALMRDFKVKLVEKSDEPERTNVLMQPIPADINSKNMNADGTTVTGATNNFEMSVRIDLVFSQVEGRDIWNMVGISEGLGLRFVDVRWKVAPFTEFNAEDLVNLPAKTAKGSPPPKKSDLYFDLANRDIDQRTKIGLAMQRIDKGALMASSAYPLLATKEGVLDTFEHQFSKIPGIYLIAAETTPRPLVDEKYRRIYPPSRAILPVRVATSRDLASETVAERPDAIAAKERAKADPDLTERQRLLIDADIDRLKKQEGMTQLGVVQVAEGDIDGQITRFSALRTWLIADYAQHPNVSGTATDDPLLVRLSAYDKLHDTHHFDTFQEFFGLYGDHAFDIKYLADPIESEAGQNHSLNQHLKLLSERKKETQKLQGRIKEQEKKFKSTTQTVATLVIAKTGNVVPLLLLVGEAPDKESEDGKHRYKIVDLTLSSTKLYDPDKQTYGGDLFEDPKDALHSAFVTYGEKNEYEPGTIFYRFANEGTLRSVPNVRTASEVLQDVATFLAILGMIATVVASGGATTPAVAAVIAAITLASGALGVYLSSQKLASRSAAGTLKLDADAVLEVINIVASVVGVGSLLRGAQLNRAVQAARTAGNLARTASALAKIERLGRNMLIFDTAMLGLTAVVTGWKVEEDLAKVRDLHLPPAEEAELIKQVAADAAMQGAMIAFQSVMLARSHYDMYRSSIEKSRYQSFEERGWIDADGRVTDKAPPTMRAVAEHKTPPLGEKPPVSLESDLPLVKTAAEQGKAKRLPNDPEHDLEIPFRDVNGEPHTMKRRREDGVWCRYSNPYCFITNADIERIEKQIGDLDGPHDEPDIAPASTPKPAPRGAKSVPGKTWGKIGYETAELTQTLEKTGQKAIDNLKAAGVSGVNPSEYGTMLHAEAAALFRKMKLPKGWRAVIEQPLGTSGLIDPKIANMTVEEFLENFAPWLLGKVRRDFLYNKKNEPQLIKNIAPDLVLVAPDGTKIVWDLTPTHTPEHMAKTLVYAHTIDPKGGRLQIGETYYRPERNLKLNKTAQNRFRGTAADAEGARINLDDDAAGVLARKYYGKGEPIATLPRDPELRKRAVAGQADMVKKGQPLPGPLPVGNSGAAEMIKGDEVIGEFFDPQTKTWVPTKNFTIRYEGKGAYIQPEAP